MSGAQTLPHALEGRTILVIEDDPVLLRNLLQWFQQTGCCVMGARDGAEGFELFLKRRPDAVVTDLIMPNREGIETLMAIKSEAPEVMVLAISGGGRVRSLDLLRTARGLGADAVLAKPFRSSEVINAVAGLLRSDA